MLSVLALYAAERPGSSLFTHFTASLLIPDWSVSVANNVLMTLLISGRIFWTNYKLSQSINALSLSHSKLYFSITAILIESAALYSVVGILQIVLFAKGSPYYSLVDGIFDQVEVSSETDMILLGP